MRKEKLRVGIIFGGRSAEYEVSLASARSIINHLDASRYMLYFLAIDKFGRWYYAKDAEALLKGTVPSAPVDRLTSADLLPVVERLSEVDVILPVLHGPYGEDGKLQGFLDLADLPYVGCGVLASAVAMDKGLSKRLFQAEGLPVLPFRILQRRVLAEDRELLLTELESQFAYPIFVKPANLGSSVGITKADNRSALWAGLQEAARFDRRLIVEQGIAAREIEVSVLGNDYPTASLPGEVIPGKAWYDYEAKYQNAGSQTVVPAALSPALTEQVRDIALRAFRAIDGSGLARVDFLLDKGSGTLYLNELNTFPGFTEISMYPKLWEATGLSYGALLDKLLSLALEPR